MMHTQHRLTALFGLILIGFFCAEVRAAQAVNYLIQGFLDDNGRLKGTYLDASGNVRTVDINLTQDAGGAFVNAVGCGVAIQSVVFGRLMLSTAVCTPPSIIAQPISATGVVGSRAEFRVTVNYPIAGVKEFVWYKDGSRFHHSAAPAYKPNADESDTLVFPNLSANDAGQYWVEITGLPTYLPTATVLKSNVFSITVISPAAPVITMHPAAQTVALGGSASFTVAANGFPTPSFQWRKDGLEINGATSATLTVPSVTLANSGTYTVVVSNTSGTVTSNAATLAIASTTSSAPSITTQPSSQTAPIGGSVSFTIAASGTPRPTFQWRKDSVAISGATDTTFSINVISANSAGNYTVIASNSFGTVTSNTAVLTVVTSLPVSPPPVSPPPVSPPPTIAPGPPIITKQPINQSALPGARATFAVEAAGVPAPNFQWRIEGTDIRGATNSTLGLSNLVAALNGEYSVVVSNTHGSVTSNIATLVVIGTSWAPRIRTQPIGQTATAGATVTFTVAAGGEPLPRFQWQKDGVAIAGATTTTLTLNNVSEASAGSYTVVVTNSVYTVSSNPASLRIVSAPPASPAVISTMSAPVIATQPNSQSVLEGEMAAFSVIASGTPMPSYQWLKNDIPISGASSATLTLNPVSAEDAGSYKVVVSNSEGKAVSSAVTLVCNPSSTLSNLSVRTALAFGETLIVGGYIKYGEKRVLLRAVGPTLSNFGLAGVPDPQLTVFVGNRSVASNDNWFSSVPGNNLDETFKSVGAFPLDTTSRDSAIMVSLSEGFTVQSKSPGFGTILVETYDLSGGASPRLVNVSARNRVGAGSDILIAGFVIKGTGRKNVLIRAVGPSLAAFGVSGALTDPRVVLYDSSGVIVASNDSWTPTLSPTFDRVGAFPLIAGSKDAALLVVLSAGSYTVQVSGADGGIGDALIEVYEVF